ncbi:MAG: hypothetical protein M5U28_45695 [Sandaracinaceae bacterium]|nr:hypothetical protein [Sandaracinaceae bacterium]
MVKAIRMAATVACTPDLEERQPDPRAEDEVQGGRPHAQHVREDRQREEPEADAQREDRHLIGVEDRDHQHGADVVDDREGRQEHLEARRDAIAQHREHAEREGDVGGHGDAPARALGTARVDREVDQRGHEHAADGGDGRQARLAHRRELPGHELALDLEAHDEEEDPHQAVVDPVVDGLLQRRARQLHARLEVQQVVVGLRVGRVGPHDRDQGRAEEQPRARQRVVHERAKRVEEALDRSVHACSARRHSERDAPQRS